MSRTARWILKCGTISVSYTHLLGVAAPQLTALSLLGDLFVGALKAVAPLLVLFLVMGALSNHKEGKQTNMKSIIGLYLLGTFLAGCVAVVARDVYKRQARAIPTGQPDTTDPSRCILCMRCVAICPQQARALPAPMLEALRGKLAPFDAERRENELFL